MRVGSLDRKGVCLLLVTAAAACSSERITDSQKLTSGVARYARTGGAPAFVVNVSNDTTAQNETPIAVNPRNPENLLTGANDWNYNDGCSVNASFDGGKTWTPTLPNGF